MNGRIFKGTIDYTSLDQPGMGQLCTIYAVLYNHKIHFLHCREEKNTDNVLKWKCLYSRAHNNLHSMEVAITIILLFNPSPQSYSRLKATSQPLFWMHGGLENVSSLPNHVLVTNCTSERLDSETAVTLDYLADCFVLTRLGNFSQYFLWRILFIHLSELSICSTSFCCF